MKLLSWLASRGRREGREGETSICLRKRDCHTHVVPGVDDGSRDTTESLAMVRLLAAEGVERIIATPHIFPGRFPNEPEGLRVVFDGLVAAVASEGIGVELELGAEHYLDDSLIERVAQRRVIEFGEERYVLFETYTGGEAPAGLFDLVREMKQGGYTPLMAHVERYGYLRGTPGREMVEDLRCAGVRFQVNRTVGRANMPGEGSRGNFLSWLRKKNWIDEVGSDLHRATPDGRPHMMPA
ncbi:MAG: CpsB/CapC family capsule biosynthesis tyrosine phosphatase [Nannocystaceae bacterium]